MKGMDKMLILNEEELQSFYTIEDAIIDVENALLADRKGRIDNPIRTVIDIEEQSASSVYMPSASKTENKAAVKVVTIFPNNPKQGKPTTQGIIVLSDMENGEHLAVISATYLTKLRTGAVSGIATKHLARKNASSVAVIGTGGMAYDQLSAVLAVRDIYQVYLYNRTTERAESFKKTVLEKHPLLEGKIEVVSTAEIAVEQSSIVICSTRSETPVFDGKVLKPGTHINGVGSYLPHMIEVDLETIAKSSKIVVDTIEGVQHEAGELIHAANATDWTFDDVYAEVSELVAGEKVGRESEEEITFFKCVGTGYFDLAVAIGAYNKAKELGIGQVVEI